MVAAGEPEELPVEVLLQEDCAAAVDPGRGGVKAGSDDFIRDPEVAKNDWPLRSSLALVARLTIIL